jgi:hypothetical protein
MPRRPKWLDRPPKRAAGGAVVPLLRTAKGGTSWRGFSDKEWKRIFVPIGFPDEARAGIDHLVDTHLFFRRRRGKNGEGSTAPEKLKRADDLGRKFRASLRVLMADDGCVSALIQRGESRRRNLELLNEHVAHLERLAIMLDGARDQVAPGFAKHHRSLIHGIAVTMDEFQVGRLSRSKDHRNFLRDVFKGIDSPVTDGQIDAAITAIEKKRVKLSAENG